MSKNSEYSYSSNTFQKSYIPKMTFYDLTNWTSLQMLLLGQKQAN